MIEDFNLSRRGELSAISNPHGLHYTGFIWFPPRDLDYIFSFVSNGGSWFLCSGAPPLGAGHARPPRRLTRLLLRPRGCATPAAFPTREILPFTLTHGGAFRCVCVL